MIRACPEGSSERSPPDDARGVEEALGQREDVGPMKDRELNLI
jgi:hypothetical protein